MAPSGQHGFSRNQANVAPSHQHHHRQNLLHRQRSQLQSLDATLQRLLLLHDQYLGSGKRILSYDTTGLLNTSSGWQTSINSYLTDPVCQGSMINYTTTSNKDVLLFSNPNNNVTRSSLGVRQSYDWGKTWSQALILDASYGGYSDIAIVSSTNIGLIYESKNVGAVTFVLFPYSKIPAPQ